MKRLAHGKYKIQETENEFIIDDKWTIYKDSGACYWVDISQAPASVRDDGDIPQHIFKLRDTLLTQ